jgi:hypothetical protein
MSEQAEEGPDRTTKSFTLADLEWARREGYKQGIETTLVLVEAGGSVAYIRKNLLDGSDD